MCSSSSDDDDDDDDEDEDDVDTEDDEEISYLLTKSVKFENRFMIPLHGRHRAVNQRNEIKNYC
jgi:hypothetical protein